MNQSYRGKAVILGIFLLAVMLGGYAWWHQYRQGRRCREFLGSQTVKLIRLAPRVELLRLAEDPATGTESTVSGTPDAKLRIDGTRVTIVELVEITQVPGLLHARHALLQDQSFQWDAPTSVAASHWTFGLRFVGEGEQATLVFDTLGNQIGLGDTNRKAALAPELMQRFADKIDEWESRASSGDAP